MPYVGCRSCGLTAFTAAYRGSVEHCERCGAELPRPTSSSSDSERARVLRGRVAHTPRTWMTQPTHKE
jgi:hypothetical protein